MQKAFDQMDTAFKEIDVLVNSVDKGVKDQKTYDELDDVIDGSAGAANEVVSRLLDAQKN